MHLDKPLERSFGSIRKWLHWKFNVNPKTHLFTVHTVTSWETNGDFAVAIPSLTPRRSFFPLWMLFAANAGVGGTSAFILGGSLPLPCRAVGLPAAPPLGGRGLHAIKLKF